jgi:DNA-binding NarL/FixJ family response regulator
MYAPDPITVVVGQFEDLLARGLRGLIEDEPGLELVAADVPHARLEIVLRMHHPRVAIVNFGSMQSPAEVRELAGQHPETRLLVLANRPSEVESAQLLAFGAFACLSKGTQARDILNAVHLAARGIRLASRATPGASAGAALLTARESEVLVELQHRRSNAQIAAALHISIETVRTHARSIYRKLGVSSRRELLATPPPVAVQERNGPEPARSRLQVVKLPRVS